MSRPSNRIEYHLFILLFVLQNRARNIKFIAKYEKKVQDLTNQCKLKSDECYQAWLSLSAANEELEKLKMEHDTRLFQSEALGTTPNPEVLPFSEWVVTYLKS